MPAGFVLILLALHIYDRIDGQVVLRLGEGVRHNAQRHVAADGDVVSAALLRFGRIILVVLLDNPIRFLLGDMPRGAVQHPAAFRAAQHGLRAVPYRAAGGVLTVDVEERILGQRLFNGAVAVVGRAAQRRLRGGHGIAHIDVDLLGLVIEAHLRRICRALLVDKDLLGGDARVVEFVIARSVYHRFIRRHVIGTGRQIELFGGKGLVRAAVDIDDLHRGAHAAVIVGKADGIGGCHKVIAHRDLVALGAV